LHYVTLVIFLTFFLEIDILFLHSSEGKAMGIQCPKCHHENPEGALHCSQCGAPLKSAEGVSVTKTLITPKENLQKSSIVAGRYNIIEELGRGGMGVVYKAEDTKLKRTVALKFLPAELTHVPEVKTRFIREAQAAASLDHPNICMVHEFDEAEGKPFISMAYIEGRSLKEKLVSGPLETEEALRIAMQVAEGLQEAHNKGIVHRDIKTGNIMVTERGQVKIMDFGLARTAERTLLTKEGTTMGTVAYMSPEQTQGEEVDHRTDIWSFGVVFYEMLTGKLPFKGEHEQAIVYSIQKEKPKPVTDLRSEIPVSIEQVINKALEKNPEKRYQEIDKLLDDLKSISAGIVPEEIRARIKKEKLRRKKRAILYAGAAIVIVALVIVALSLFTGPAEAIESIAVLPLENLTGDVEKEYFVDGVTDELIGQLSQISALRVISRQSMMRYRDSDKLLPEIARELHVDAVVVGSVQQAGDIVRIRVQLIDALPEEQNLWGQTYEQPMTEILAMYNKVARAIVNEVQITLTPKEEARLSTALQVNPQAYEAYLRGMSHLYRFTPPELDAALYYFEQALEIDPDYALAYAGISLVWVSRQQYGFVMPSEATPKAKEAAQRALELDDTLPDVHYTLAIIRTWSDWDWEGGEQAFKRALELKPNFAEALAYYSTLLCYMDRMDEALAMADRAMQLDPINSLILSISATPYEYLRRYDDAIELAHKALRTSPNDLLVQIMLWNAYYMKGMYEESLESAKAVFTGLGFAEISEIMAEGYEENGYHGAMMSAADTMAEFSNQTYSSPYLIAEMYVFAGDKDKAMEWLERAYEMRDPIMPYVSSPYFDLLDDDPRYQDLLRRMNLPVDEKK
jgi:TolB-like protein/predicted Ser/Thr protein kinase/lipoprotein NlpI